MFLHEFNRLVVQIHLTVAEKMFEMCPDYHWSLPDYGLHHGFFIVIFCFTFDDRDCSFRADTYAGTETITEKISDEPCFPVNDLKGTLRAVRDAKPASRTSVFINTDYFPFHSGAPGYFFMQLDIRCRLLFDI